MPSIADRIVSLRTRITENDRRLAVLESDIKKQKKELCSLLGIEETVPIEKVLSIAQVQMNKMEKEIAKLTDSLTQKIEKLEALLNE